MYTSTIRLAIVTLAALLWTQVADAQPAAPAQGEKGPTSTGAATDDAINPRWLDRLDPVDRALLDDLIGFAPPPFEGGITWVGSEGLTWESMRGRVVVLQSWSNHTSGGRKIPRLLERSLGEFEADDVQVVLLQTPDGAEKLQRFLERREVAWPVAVDSTGAFCDDLGIYKRPVNVIVDRVGNVRYAGLNARGLAPAVQRLVDEPYDASKKPLQPAAADPPPAPTEFPVFTNDVGSATDFRSRRAPEFFVQHWMTPKPDPRGKVVVLDFWATWCKPCIQSVPHMNELADAFRDDVLVVGIAGEDSASFNKGMQRLKNQGTTLNSFRYPIAMDGGSTMANAFRIKTIPYCVVVSADWTVRWQGHPSRLDKTVLERIAAANRDAVVGAAPTRPRRWGSS